MVSRGFRIGRTAMVAGITLIAACSTDSGTEVTGVPLTPALSAGGVPHRDAAAALDAVLSGNAQAVAAAPFLVPPGAPLAPFIEARLYAIASIAMHDALNAIVPRFERYADAGPIDDHSADALLTAAWLRVAADRPALWRPQAMTPEIARTEGWTFGVP